MSPRYFLASDLVRAYVNGAPEAGALEELLALAQSPGMELWVSGFAPVVALESSDESVNPQRKRVGRLVRVLAASATIPVGGKALAQALAAPDGVAKAEALLLQRMPSVVALTLQPEVWGATGVPAQRLDAFTELPSATKVPLVDLLAQLSEISDEVQQALWRTLTSSSFILGQEVQKFEEEFAAFCGASHAVALNSGTDALHLGLRALGVGPNDGVITVSFTFAATAEAIVMAGAVPLFVDINPKDYTMAPDAVAEFLAKRARSDSGELRDRVTGTRIKAILPVHLYGQPADMERLTVLARQYRLAVLEDAAQAHGAAIWQRDRWVRAGSLGDAGAFSFYPAKNLGAYGDAGALVTSEAGLARQARLLRDHGRTSKYVHQVAAWSSRMDAMQAAVLRVKLRHLERWIEARCAAAARYGQLLARVPGVHLPSERPGVHHVYHLYVVRVPTGVRGTIQQALGEQGFETGVHYPISLHEQPAFQRFPMADISLSVSQEFSGEVLSLPLYPGITESQQRAVTQALSACVEGRPSSLRRPRQDYSFS